MPLHKKRAVDTTQIGLFNETVNASSPNNWWSRSTERKRGLYAITHRASGRFYIGSSLDIFKRWLGHRRDLLKGKHHSRFLQRAWDKYGAEAFLFQILVEVNATQNLSDLEQQWLDAYAGPPLYNVNGRADRPPTRLGQPVSSETREKLRQAGLGRHLSPEAIEKLRLANIGRPRPLAAREKQRQAMTGRTLSAAQRAAISLALTGRKQPSRASRGPHSAATKEKMRQIRLANPTIQHAQHATRGTPLTPARKEQIRQARLGTTHTAATKEKMRQGQKRAREQRMALPPSPDTGYLSI